VLFTCQAGYEDLMAREAAGTGMAVPAKGPGWVEGRGAGAEAGPAGGWCFARMAVASPETVDGASVNALAAGLASQFLDTARGERFDEPWPLVVACAAGVPGLARRAAAVEAAARERLQKKMSRVMRLATAPAPRGGTARGWFVHLPGFDRAFAGRTAWFGGQRRMAGDPAAPSRSFLKAEEAYGVLGCEPAPGETVADLGAAPGGWSFSAARRGARVVAVDNGPLKGGAAGHPRIEHRMEDAFGFRPGAAPGFDWLFCDLVEEPHHVLRAIVVPWLERGWCRRFVINLKFGRADVFELLERIGREAAPRCAQLAVRHLFHDREEITMVGETARERVRGAASQGGS
jgi:23S rRNA (cytidine2498-2'-O)-methyltransferase